MIDKIIDNSGILGSILAGIIAFFGGRKMKEIEERKANSDALEGIQRVYEKFVIQTENKFDLMEKEMMDVKNLLKKYIDQCSSCENNKMK
jgi:hypothetical protein